MFNKIVASVISSVVLFACNVKDDVAVTPVAEDVVSSVEQAAPAAPAVTDDGSVKTTGSVVATPVVAPVVSGEAAGGASVPLAAPSTGVGVTSTVTSTPASSVSPVVAPTAATVTK